MEKIKNKNTGILLVIITMLFLSASFFGAQKIFADNSITELSGEAKATQDKLDELQKRADVYRQIIDIKKKQTETLNNQLSIADSSIEEVQAQIEVSKQQIDEYNAQIGRIETQIKEKNNLIERQKYILSNLIQAYYQINSTNPLVSYFSNGDVASFIVKKDKIGQVGDKIKELISDVNDAKAELEAQTQQLDKKKGEFVVTSEKLQSQGSALESAKKQKANLLAQTQGEEARYTQLLARVEEQKQELVDIDQFYATSGISVESFDKPSSKYFASIDWYFSQRDPKWGNETIGNTKTLMKSYGCAVTAVAMVFKQHGGSVDPGKLSSEPIFSGDLINWPATWSSPRLTLAASGKAHGNINWSVIDSQIAKNIPVIVYIGKSQGGGGHYVVIHHKDSSTGKYIVHDPYFGANIYLDTSRALVGAMGIKSGTSINQMIIYN
jgi:peptidoglycan hydrolase CwlO-like protein